MKTSSLRTGALAILIAASASLIIPVAPLAIADPVQNVEQTEAPPSVASLVDMDSLVKDLEASSEKVSAQNEEFKQLQVDIEKQEKAVAETQDRAKAASEAAREAGDEEREAKALVDKLAASKYRGTVVDPITTVINAQGPQNAIDRSAYMTAYVRKAQAALATQREKSEKAGRLANDASRLQAQAQFEMRELSARKVQLEKQEKELHERIEEVKARIDALSPVDRQAWEMKNGPVAYDLAGVTSTNAEGMKALEAAMTKLGAPYGWGSAGPDAFDCSGLVVWAYQQQGKTLPRTSQAQMAGGAPVSRDELQPGDVVGFYPGATHVAIYAGNGKVVHASDYGIPLQVVNLDSMPFYGARRY